MTYNDNELIRIFVDDLDAAEINVPVIPFFLAKKIEISMVVPWNDSKVISGRFEVYVDFGEKTDQDCIIYGVKNGFNYVGITEGRCWGSKLPYLNLGSTNDE